MLVATARYRPRPVTAPRGEVLLHQTLAAVGHCAGGATERAPDPGRAHLLLGPPDNPLHRRALRGLCDNLNQLGVRYPGTDLDVSVTYEVEMHHSEAAA